MSTPEPSHRVECTHCGLDVPGSPQGPGPHFCCPGCRAVYGALHQAGLEEFYDFRQVDGRTPDSPIGDQLPQARPDFDADWYTENHTQKLEDGTCEAELYLEGVHCAGCVWITERMPRYLDGVLDSRLDLARARLTVRWDPEQTKLSSAAGWLTRFGYAPHPIRGERDDARTRGERKLLFKVGVSWALAANVMLLAFALYAGLDFSNDAGLTGSVRWLSLVLSAGSVVYGGSQFFRRAAVSVGSLFSQRGWDGLFKLSMDVPISLGIAVGWGHSAWATVTGSGEVWFDSIAVLIAALLTARWLQVRGRRAAGDAADRLLSLVPTTARRVTGQDEPQQVAVEELVPGDIVEVRPGEVVPVDGALLTEQTSAHRAVLTGESRPERVRRGETMHAGETNMGSLVRLRVDAVGDDTRVGKLLAWVEERSKKRAPIVQRADRMGGAFVVLTLLAAAITAVVWWQLDPSRAVAHVVALLVVACPCALGMATPLALAVGVGQAAREGIYIKHDDVLEALADVGWIVLDKTGTLTEAQMKVTEATGAPEAIALAAALEAHSNHPIAAALVDYAEQREDGAQNMREASSRAQKMHAKVERVEEHAGAGLCGRVEDKDICVGRPDWVAQRATASEKFSLDERVERMTARGSTPVAVAVDGRVEAVLGVGDPVRGEAAKFLRELKRRQIEPIVLSGDHSKVVEHVAEQLGIAAENAHGGVSPEGKAAFIEQLKDRGDRKVAMVGDGVNDAAALQLADIGIAVDGGAEASLVAADVFMTRPGLEPVYALVQGSQKVMGVVHRNLWMSAGYNALAVFAAGFGLIGPLIAAVAMPTSSIAVVVSSLIQSSFGKRRADRQMSCPTWSGEPDEHPISADSPGPVDSSGGDSRLLVGDAQRPI